MRAVTPALFHFNLLTHSAVLVSTDNTTVVSYINREGGTRSANLWAETQELFQVVLSRQWTPQGGTHTGTSQCDSGPPIQGPTEWSLHPAVV